MTLLSFFTVADDFKDFFLMEAELNKKFFTEGTKSGLQPAEETLRRAEGTRKQWNAQAAWRRPNPGANVNALIERFEGLS